MSLRCEFCGEEISSLAALQRHTRIDHAGRPSAPRCEACGLTFDSPADLKAHHEGVHGVRRS
jgi:Zinc finger, C2H2 type